MGIGLGDPVVASRRVIALPTDAEQRQRLLEISRSRTEPTSQVKRARCLERAAELGVIEALDDRPRAGRDPVSKSRRQPHLPASTSSMMRCQTEEEKMSEVYIQRLNRAPKTTSDVLPTFPLVVLYSRA
jgi:hypothetical protein